MVILHKYVIIIIIIIIIINTKNNNTDIFKENVVFSTPIVKFKPKLIRNGAYRMKD